MREAKGSYENPRQGPLTHSVAMVFIGILLIVGITLGGMFFFGGERGETGISVPEQVGVATEPLTQQTLPSSGNINDGLYDGYEDAKKSSQPAEQEQISPPYTDTISSSQEKYCKNGIVTYEYLFANWQRIVDGLVKPKYEIIKSFDSTRGLSGGIFKVVIYDKTADTKFDMTVRDFGREQKEMWKKIEWENTINLADNAFLRTVKGDDYFHFRGDNYYWEIFATGKAEDLQRLGQDVIAALRC